MCLNCLFRDFYQYAFEIDSSCHIVFFNKCEAILVLVVGFEYLSVSSFGYVIYQVRVPVNYVCYLV